MTAMCECADKNCPGHPGQDCPEEATRHAQVVYRVDMEDRSGTLMCEFCALDALDSGLFTTSR